MKLKNKKIMTLFALTVLIAAFGLTGCDTADEAANTDGERKLTYWTSLTSTASSLVTNLGDTPMMQKAQEMTGIDVEFIHPPQGQVNEKFNILIASGEYPDIIQYRWTSYPGGPQKAINEKIIVDLNTLKEDAPNFFSYLEKHDEVRKLSLTDSGALFSFPFIRGDESLLYSSGLIIRQDWLDELGLAMPETIEEWETVLTAFRDKKNCKAPLSMNIGHFGQVHAFAGAYGVGIGYYLDNGQVKYGMAEDGYKDFLTLLNKWYDEGLLDQDFSTLDSTTMDANILNGNAGVVQGSIGNGIGRYMNAAPDDTYQLAGAPYPVRNKGEVCEFGAMNTIIPLMNNAFAAISADSKNQQLAAQFLDFGYSQEGQMLYNFGIEGESYEMIDGYPTYTDLITNNPEGLSMSSALSMYTYAYDAGPTIQDKRYMEQYASLPEQKEAWATWSTSNMANHLLPYLYVKDDEVNELANLSNSVETYANEMTTKLIMGIEPLENYDSIVEELNNRGLGRILEMKQAAYERYLNK
ncbi:extracellular solute-binding protein [Ructibacterium gallinarum]|uniref:Extracellular solute-binding protein n=1 Tax=Ructibacterium gallinarum TaxID=2779355 RepID=A0A9D5M3F1_9FIRM|nr:extracellular solute-binding protein [Ructibacterium gallinarum]MBE5040808.1 extracellular solute-binding protein [Ructibacterium gallinarum]